VALEIETTVTFGKAPEIISVWTNDPKWVRRIMKAGIKPTRVGDRQPKEPCGYWFDVPEMQFRMRFRSQADLQKAKATGVRLQRAQQAQGPNASM